MLSRIAISLIIFLFAVFPIFAQLVGPGDFAMVQMAQNIIAQTKTLKEILTDQRELTESFEQVNRQVETKIWQADRFVMWMEDIREMDEIEVHDIDGFNSALSDLKQSKIELEDMWKEQVRESQEAKRLKERIKSENSRDQRRYQSYANNSKGSMTPSQAQVETAKHTQEIVMETSKLNSRVNRLTDQVAEINIRDADIRNRQIIKEAHRKKTNHQLEKGALKRSYVEAKK